MAMAKQQHREIISISISIEKALYALRAAHNNASSAHRRCACWQNGVSGIGVSAAAAGGANGGGQWRGAAVRARWIGRFERHRQTLTYLPGLSRRRVPARCRSGCCLPRMACALAHLLRARSRLALRITLAPRTRGA